MMTAVPISWFLTLSAILFALGVAGFLFRRNIITRGKDLNELIGQEFDVQGVRFLGTGEAAPCHWMNQAFGEGAEEALKGFGGLRARVLSDGTLCSETVANPSAV